MFITIIIISAIFVSLLIFAFGKSRRIEKKDTAGTNFEICFSLGIFISFYTHTYGK